MAVQSMQPRGVPVGNVKISCEGSRIEFSADIVAVERILTFLNIPCEVLRTNGCFEVLAMDLYERTRSFDASSVKIPMNNKVNYNAFASALGQLAMSGQTGGKIVFGGK